MKDLLNDGNYDFYNKIFSNENITIKNFNTKEKKFSDLKEFMRFTANEKLFWWSISDEENRKENPHDVNLVYTIHNQHENYIDQLRHSHNETKFRSHLKNLKESLNRRKVIFSDSRLGIEIKEIFERDKVKAINIIKYAIDRNLSDITQKKNFDDYLEANELIKFENIERKNSKIKSIEINKFKGFDSIKIENLDNINAFFGKNNSGKSSILHAIEFATTPLRNKSWEDRKFMLDPEIVITEKKNFNIKLECYDESQIAISSTDDYQVRIRKEPNTNNVKLNSILIFPDSNILQRKGRHYTPKDIWNLMEARDFSQITGLEMLFALQYFGDNSKHNISSNVYKDIENEIKKNFPEIEHIYPTRTEEDIATIKFKEYGKRTLELVYSGTGMRNFLDIIIKSKFSKADIILLDEPEMGLHPDQQRKLIDFLDRFSQESNVQIFMATHSPVMLNFVEKINYYKVHNKKGVRSVVPVSKDSIHTLMSDIGIKPSDFLNKDICIMVEGQSDVIFFEHVIRTFFKDEFKNIHVGVIQYGGSAADGIIHNKIDISNLVSAQKYSYWIRDRDSRPEEEPNSNSKKFCNKIRKADNICQILKKREIEFYFPDEVLINAQKGNKENEKQILKIKYGDQKKKFRVEAKGLCVPEGRFLKKLLENHMVKKSQIENELVIYLKTLVKWGEEIIGEEEEIN